MGRPDEIPSFGPAFDIAVAPGGYAWWYLDALSDDGQRGLTVIAFVGSVFSPYYAWARRRDPQGNADPTNHCALNVVTYRRVGGGRWAMTERGRDPIERRADSFRIGPSSMRWEADTLVVEIDEIASPLPSRIRGSVRLHAPLRFDHTVEIAPRHRWRPIAPSARVEVDLCGERWTGSAYLDSNQGDEPMERAFDRWDWSRAELPGGGSAVLYDVDRIGAEPLHVALRFGTDGSVTPFEPPPRAALPATRWRVARQARSDAGTTATVVKTLTDAPFYARSLIDARWLGEAVTAMHESLSMRRFDTAWVQAMLPFRMPRR